MRPRPSSGVRWTPVLANTFAFAVAFAAWIMLGPSARVVAEEMQLSPAEATFLKALPILTGAVLRIPIGLLADRVGATRVFPALLLVGAAAAAVLSRATSYEALLAGALLLGLVGTTFVCGVQVVASVTPPTLQGTTLGIFGAGNAGTAITTLAMPVLLVSLGWRRAFEVYAAVVAVTAVAYVTIVRSRMAPPASAVGRRSPLAPLGDARTWLLAVYYMASFGTFVAATLALADVYVDGYGRSLATAGVLATTFTLTASLARIPGGALADRWGANGVLRVALPVTAAALAIAGLGVPMPVAAALLVVAALAMGTGMSATFKAIPTFFPNEVGAVGGVVGALGALAGFYLPLAGVLAVRASDVVFHQFLPLAALAGVAAIGPWWTRPDGGPRVRATDLSPAPMPHAPWSRS